MSDKIELNRRRVLGGIATVGAASAALGAGTFAYFSDTESRDVEFTAGNIDLVVNGIEDTSGGSVSIANMAPGDLESWDVTISNDGSLEGRLFIQFGYSDTDDGGSGLEDYLTLSWSVGDESAEYDPLTKVPPGWIDTKEVLSPGDDPIDGTLEVELPSSITDAEGEAVNIEMEAQLVQTKNRDESELAPSN